MKKIKIVTITLVIIAITMIAFLGVYVPNQNRMENKVKDYEYGMDLKGSRNIRLKVSTQSKTVVKDAEGNIIQDAESLTDEQIAENGYTKEEIPYNGEEIKNTENYKESKRVIEERLQKLGVNNYIIKLDEQTGDMVIELPEDEKTDSIISNIATTGKFEIVDSQTNEVLMTNDDIKSAKVMYGTGSQTSSTGTSVYLDIEFNKEGAKKLEEISNNYVVTEETVSEENTTTEEVASEEATTEETTVEEAATEETTIEEAATEESVDSTTEKKISMKIDDEEIMSTSFDEPLRTGKLQLSIGSAATDEATLQDYIDRASNMANVLDTGKIPVKYDIDENQYILSDITENEIQIAEYIVLGIIAIGLIIFIIKYKTLGVLGAISYVGLVSLLTIVIRYTNVILSIEGLLGMLVIFILNYIFINKLLSSNNNPEAYKEFFIKILPIIILAITFCFVNWLPISSFGMVMFWGIVLIAAYNGIVTNYLLKIKLGKEK